MNFEGVKSSAKRAITFLKSIVVTTVAGLGAPALWAEEPTEITWYRYDLPPYHILRGEFEGQGPLDYIYTLERQWLDGYEHRSIDVNVSRMNREFQSSKDHRCITSSFKFPISEPHWVWSKALYVEPPAVVVAGQKVAASLGDQQSVDFEVLLQDPSMKFGHFDGRIYGGIVDESINRHLGAPNVLAVSSYASGESLMRMLDRGRVDYIVEYLPEIHWLALSGQVASKKPLHSLTIRNHRVLSPVHIGCANTPWGRQTIDTINSNLNRDILEAIWRRYERWLHSDFAIEFFRQAQQEYFGRRGSEVSVPGSPQ